MRSRNIKIKVCGITREKDLKDVLDLGVNFIGLNLWPQSPRSINLQTAKNLSTAIPKGSRVMVDVATNAEDLKKYEPHFDFFQIHFPFDIDFQQIKIWLDIVGRHRLWLAPKIPPEVEYPEALLNVADTFVFDTYRKESFGGTGQTGNWAHFSVLRDSYPEKKWILAGGLSPENIVDALNVSKATIIDVNSGIETAPGIKSKEKLKKLIEVV